MEHELIWGLPVILYLFLAGLGAGALITSASLLLRGKNNPAYFRLARYGAVLAIPTVAVGTAMIVFELGSFQVGHWFKWINLYKVINLSPMSLGSWLLVLYFVITVPYVYTFLVPNSHSQDRLARLRKGFAYPCIVLGVGVAVYTGVMLGAIPARPLWNSPILAMLFLISAISTGIALVIISDWIADKTGIAKWCAEHLGWDREQDSSETTNAGYLLVATDTIFLGLEILMISLFFMYAHLTVGDVRMSIKVIEFGGALSGYFWIGVVLFGLTIPAILETRNILPRLLGSGPYVHSDAMVVIVPLMVIMGGFFLRYVIVVGGQIAKLAGI